jgi:release factor glutamine methyltransferase
MSADVWTIRRLLEWTTAHFQRCAVDSPRLAAELLLAHVLAVPRLRLYTDYERVLAAGQLETLRGLVRRAVEHEPVAYLTGRAFFFGLELEVTRDVLIPRPETETLVENVIRFCRRTPGLESPRILDLCTGSGCIALALAKNLPTARVVATDISPAALAVARRNLQRLGMEERVTFAEGDLFGALAGVLDPAPFHLIVANPPYIASGQVAELPRNVRDYEPHLALDGGTDGLAILRTILATAPRHLRPEGRIYLELAFDQGPAAQAAAQAAGTYTDLQLLRDDAGHQRVLSAALKGAEAAVPGAESARS